MNSGFGQRMAWLIPALVLAVVSFLALASLGVSANPIPINTNLLWLEREEIDAGIWERDGSFEAVVVGKYPFRLSGHFGENATALEEMKERASEGFEMMFPVPPDSKAISVLVNQTTVAWEWVSEPRYETTLGDFKFISWIVSVPEDALTVRDGLLSCNFLVLVGYSHSLVQLQENGSWVMLYALGTARAMGAYNYFKQDCEVLIRAELPRTATFLSAEVLGEFPNFEVSTSDSTVIMEGTLSSNTGDFLLSLEAGRPPVGPRTQLVLVFAGIGAVFLAALAVRRRA